MSDIRWNFRPCKGEDVGERAGGTHSKNLAIWNFGYEFHILKKIVFQKMNDRTA